MKYVQVIDGAVNCTYDVFMADDEEFSALFPGPEQDVEFVEDIYNRLDSESAKILLASLWSRRAEKKNISGIDGTLFCGLDQKRPFYPTKREDEMIASPP